MIPENLTNLSLEKLICIAIFIAVLALIIALFTLHDIRVLADALDRSNVIITSGKEVFNLTI